MTPTAPIDSLYSLRNETLGGILPPITFPRDRTKRDVNNRIVVGKAVNGAFAPLDNDPDKFTCAPGWKPAGA